MEKVFRGFQGLPCFPWLGRFDVGSWQTSKQIYRKLQYREEVFGEV